MGDVNLKDIRNECLKSLYACTENISKYLESDKAEECFNDLRGFVKNYCNLDFEQTACQNALQSLQQESNLDSLEEKYEDELLRQTNTQPNFDNHPYMENLERHIRATQLTQTVAEDEETAITGTQEMHIDPLTRRPLRIPIRNILCKHVYEKDTIEEFIREKPKKCPYVFCTNTQMISKEHLVLDEELREKLASMAQHESMSADSEIGE